MPQCPVAYKTVFLDWFGTVCTSLFWSHWAEDPERREHAPRLQDALWADGGEVIESWMRGQMTAEEAVAVLATRVDLDPDELLRELQVSCEEMRLAPGVEEAVSALQARGVKVVLATDNMDTFQRWTLTKLELEFDGVLDSSALGALKADVDEQGQTRFFAAALKRWPGPWLLVDDRAEACVVEQFGIDLAVVSDPADTVRLLRSLAA
jgi:FMN phosphatase YigB (HAD superfamily)